MSVNQLDVVYTQQAFADFLAEETEKSELRLFRLNCIVRTVAITQMEFLIEI